ncbi:MAG: polyprenol monophosphomannose synthase [Chloroflexi bacterium]|nr:polyprenol monophosphomannose synthase [Chloroflexota bacterium]
MAQPTPQISIILPTYNEAGNIEPLIDRTLAALGNTPGGVEVVVVDDDSPDGTWRLVAEKAKTDERVRLVHRTTEKGLTSAISRGIREARGQWVGWMDCDLSMPPEEWPRLVEALGQGSGMAVGSRYVPGGADVAHSWIGRMFSRLINGGAGLLLDGSIKDYTSGFILGRKEIFEAIELRGDYGEYCIDMLYRVKKASYTIRELPYRCVPREAGESKTATNVWGYLTRGVNYVKTVWRLRFE